MIHSDCYTNKECSSGLELACGATYKEHIYSGNSSCVHKSNCGKSAEN